MLETKKLTSAILDVFSPEPISISSNLWKIPNLIITPHISADDGTSYVSQTLELFFRNFELFISEKPLLNLVNKRLGY